MHFNTGVELVTCSFGQKNPLCSSTNGIGLVNFGCVRKIGGESLMETLIHNGRSGIDWKNYKSSLDKYIPYFLLIFTKNYFLIDNQLQVIFNSDRD